ncbi:hypothetical protein CUJ84_pRLN1000569 (plasmid) [Rhizobium leguminosarum]|uniref:Uncharacterized protein n=1 Tax=Rhizobium leguminosarum TaxID=384 RepID=A0A2K9ZCR9_RHILE|nr:hypothetical protein CUJ84_pRLN1000569 [Rhizobium leguminosarum]
MRPPPRYPPAAPSDRARQGFQHFCELPVFRVHLDLLREPNLLPLKARVLVDFIAKLFQRERDAAKRFAASLG